MYQYDTCIFVLLIVKLHKYITMRNTILALLIAAFSGVRKDCLNALARVLALQCTTEDEAKELVGKLTDAQVKEFAKEYRADVDKEVSDGVKSNETNLRKKFNFVEKTKTEPGGDGGNGNGDGGNGGNGGDDLDSRLYALMEKHLAPLQEKLAKYESGEIAKTRLQMLNEKLANCKDETFKSQTLKDFNRMSFKDDEAFNEYLNEKVTDIEAANQSLADRELAGGGSPLFAQKTEQGISKGVADFIASQNPENNKFAGKSL